LCYISLYLTFYCLFYSFYLCPIKNHNKKSNEIRMLVHIKEISKKRTRRIFTLYLKICNSSEHVEENHWPVASNWQTFSHNVVSVTKNGTKSFMHEISCKQNFLKDWLRKEIYVINHNKAVKWKTKNTTLAEPFL
jgi:hypothetical protein